jgi:uncharacterized membrane protein
MENLVVTTFQNGQNANAALNKLKESEQSGDIIIYDLAMIWKTGDNTFELLHHDGPEFQDKPAIGSITGSLIGAVAGPLGMALGMLTGTMVGAIEEGEAQDFSDEFLWKINAEIETGSYAIILDVEEDTETIINSFVEPYHGTTIHSNIIAEYDQTDRRQWKELNDEIDKEENALQMALKKDKASIRAKIFNLKLERKEKLAKIRNRSVNRKKSIEEKIKAIDKKLRSSEEKIAIKLGSQKEKLTDRLKKFNEEVEWAYSLTY